MTLYVLRMDNPKSPYHHGTPTRVRLVGPFNYADEIRDFFTPYGENNPHDNPCWQTVDLDHDVTRETATRTYKIQIVNPRDFVP